MQRPCVTEAQLLGQQSRRGPPVLRVFSLGHFQNAILRSGRRRQMAYQPMRSLVSEPTRPEWPGAVEQLRRDIEREELTKQLAGEHTIGMDRNMLSNAMRVSRTAVGEHMKVTFTFRPSDYYTFSSHCHELDRKSCPRWLDATGDYLRGVRLNQANCPSSHDLASFSRFSIQIEKSPAHRRETLGQDGWNWMSAS